MTELLKIFCEIILKNLNSIDFKEFLHYVYHEHSVEKQEILSHQKNISSNQLFRNLFSKTVTFTKFLPKIREREFP